MNITLIGMSGAGKSFIGTRLAQALGLEYVDIDRKLEEAEGKPLGELVRAWGDEEFVRKEAEMAKALSTSKDNLLISTGGSIVYDEAAMRHLKEISKVVYLRVPFAVIEGRVAGIPERERRIIGIGTKTLRQLFDERVPLYEHYADIIVEAHGKGFKNIVSEISATMSPNE